MARPQKTDHLARVRNFGIAAHIDAGKTTLTERILYLTGASYKIGEVHEGTAQMDYMPEERARGITITSAVTHCQWEEHDLHLIDTPGHVDFTIEVERSMRVLDGVVIVLDAVKGVEPQSETVWRQAEGHKVPRILFINKMDRPGADFERALETVTTRLKGHPLAVTVPIERGGEWGLLDLVDPRWVTFSGERNTEVHVGEIPEDLQEIFEDWRERLIEGAADFDDAIAEKYLGGEDIGVDELKAVLRAATLGCEVQLAFAGAALRDFGTQLVLGGVLDYLPSPLDVDTVHGTDAKTEEPVDVELTPNGPFCALVFKVQMFDTRRHCYLRLYRGKLKPGDQVYNNRLGKPERVARVFDIKADRRDRMQEAVAGDLVLCAGLRYATTGDTLSALDAPVTLAPILANEPVIALSIETVNSAQDDKVVDALGKMVEEDPTLKLVEDPDSGQRLLYGMGELHLEVVLDRMAREYGVKVRTGRPRVVYRESIAGEHRGEMALERTLDSGQSHKARVVIRAESVDQDQPVEVVFDPAHVRLLPEGVTLSPSQEQWIREAATMESTTGPLAGYPLVGVRLTIEEVELFGTSSVEPAVREATARAVRDALMGADPHPLAPIMAVDIEAPSDGVGSVIGDMQSRGGLVVGMEAEESVTQIHAECAMEKLFGYATDLRSMTQGRGTFTLTFNRFDRVSLDHLGS